MDDSLPSGSSAKLLVTGADGVLGANIAAALCDRVAVLVLGERRPACIDGCATVPCEASRMGAYRDFVRKSRPQWIIHCGPLSAGSWDVPDEAPDGEMETRRRRLIAEAAAEAGSRLAVISTDAVFAGPQVFHAEDSLPTSPSPFAAAARQVEEEMLRSGALVVRTHAYGWAPPGVEPGYAERVWQALSEGAIPRFDPYRHANPILATDLAELVWQALQRKLSGLFHVAGAERTSQYRFAMEVAAAMGFRDAPIAAGNRANDDSLAGEETSLDCRRAARELRRPLPMLREGLRRFAAQATSGHRRRLGAAARVDAA